MVGDVPTLDLTCQQPADKDISDEYFTYAAPTCTRRYDRETRYYTVSDVAKANLIYTDVEHCIEEIVDVTECCTAKTLGKAGTGLEDACTTLTF